MVSGHRIEKKIPVEEFLETLTNYNREDIFCTKHTFFRLSEEQRNVFKCDTIRDFLLGQTPKLVGVQFNQLYAVFYPHKKCAILILFDLDTFFVFFIFKPLLFSCAQTPDWASQGRPSSGCDAV